jgi:hypothetical protein
MMSQAPISLEALKLKLISNSSTPTPDPLLTKDGVHYLLKALAYADADFSTEIENVLVKAGTVAVPELVKSLSAHNNNVRSVAAMTLIRMGHTVEESLLKAYPKYARKASTRWVFEFVLQELGLEIPDKFEYCFPVIKTLERVG